MNRVIIDKKAKIALKDSLLVIDNDMKIPLSSVDFLIVSNRVELTLKDISLISKKDTAILVITTNPKEFIFIQKKYLKNGDLKYKQYKALDERLEIAKSILKEKIENSYNALIYFNQNISKTKYLKDLENVKNIQTLLGIEGSLAKDYFDHYFSLFPKILSKGYRSKNPPLDPVNALLSYLYTIFYFEISTFLNYYGFEPLIGYFHTPFRSHMALSSDILEFFRADIDIFVAKLFLDKKLTIKDFSKSGKSVLLTQAGRKKLWIELKPFLEAKETVIKEKISMIKSIIEKKSS